jgi:hypothetical protein
VDSFLSGFALIGTKQKPKSASKENKQKEKPHRNLRAEAFNQLQGWVL